MVVRISKTLSGRAVFTAVALCIALMMVVRHLEADEPTAAAPSLASAAPLCVDTPILPKGLLVVVVFNNLFKANVPKLKAMYSQVDMVFCSSEEVYDKPGFCKVGCPSSRQTKGQ